jgi:hypothetical protein
MRNKLLISAAVLTAALLTAACEKTPSGEANQSSSAKSEAEQQGSGQRAEAQQHFPQLPSQLASGETEQDKPNQSTRRESEQESEPGREEAAKPGEARNNENNIMGRPSLQNRTSQSDGGAPETSPAQPNQSEQDRTQLAEQRNQPGQDHQPRGTANLNLEKGSAGSGPVNLSRDELRRVQIVLKEKGFNVGKADGVLGPRTRNALIAFQRQQGLDRTGKIDRPTITALGISNRAVSTTGGQSAAGNQ